MNFYSSDIVNIARDRRIKGVSISEISKELNIPDTTIGRWVRDIKSDSLSSVRAKFKNQEQVNKYQSVIKDFVITKTNNKLLCSLLYWCEGSKYPSSNYIAFSNSDYRLVKTFFQLFKKSFEIDVKKVRVHLQIHSNQDYKQIQSFWSSLLNIPRDQFYKPTVTNPTKNMKRLDYKGTCTFKYFDSKILLQITGIFEEFSKKFDG